MPSIRLSRVTFGFTDATTLFTDLELTFTPGWTGIVGPNGAGKSTLLGLVTGELTPTAGTVDSRGLTIAVCPQALPDHPASPGERRRRQLARVLWPEPDVLVLDEPTNHLDLDGRRWLVAALRRFRGIGLLVAHDRALLDELTTRTVSIEPGRIRDTPLAYSGAAAEWRRLDGEARARREAARAEVARQERRLVAERTAAAGATRNRRGSVRSKGKHDSDARGILRKNLAEWGEAAHSRGVALAGAALERARQELAEARVDPSPPSDVRLAYTPPPARRLVSLDDRTVNRGDRIWVSGRNGAGKSTLLAALHAKLERHRVLWLPQELDEACAPLDEVRRAPPEERGRTLALVAALGVDPDRLLASRRPSPGEARKLLIAGGMARGVWLLLLDEPTNHLDLPSIERLERALADYPGALVLASHDERFARALTRVEWPISGQPFPQEPDQSLHEELAVDVDGDHVERPG